MDLKQTWCTTLGILAVLAAFVLIFGGGYYTAHQNMLKQEQMTKYCVDHGFRGWNDSNNSRNAGDSSCVRD